MYNNSTAVCHKIASFNDNQYSQPLYLDEDYYLLADNIQEPSKTISSQTNKDRLTSLHPQQQQSQSTEIKSSELKFKIESVGNHPEEDDDLDMCPSRTRPLWPKQIIPWWIPSSPNEKPPYSYATLIAHAILSNKDGRLTLNDIYTWIADKYSAYSVGEGGWQNSIRHNLSLNKKWFCKIDRRPTQANPGKGCYWTLVVGTEEMFIDNLTHEGGHNRKHNDVGFRTDLSVGQRKGICYYSNNGASAPATSSLPSPQRTTSHRKSIDSVGMMTPPSTPTKVASFSQCTNFKMVNLTGKAQNYSTQTQQQIELISNNAGNYYSGVDVNNGIDDKEKIYKKRRRSSTGSSSTARVNSSRRFSSTSINTATSYLNTTNEEPLHLPTQSTPHFTFGPTPIFYPEAHNSLTKPSSLDSVSESHNDSYQNGWLVPTTNNSCFSYATMEPSALLMKNEQFAPLDEYSKEMTYDQSYIPFENKKEDFIYDSSTTMPPNTNTSLYRDDDVIISTNFSAMMPTIQNAINATIDSNAHFVSPSFSMTTTFDTYNPIMNTPSITPPLSPLFIAPPSHSNYLLYPSASSMPDTMYL